MKRGEGAESSALTQARDAHASACSAYVGWIRHNAVAALSTKDSAGKFGMWWTVGLLNITTASIKARMRYHLLMDTVRTIGPTASRMTTCGYLETVALGPQRNTDLACRTRLL